MSFTQLFQDNILIDHSGKVFITDFGVSRILAKSGFTTTSEPFSLRWSSIEILRALSNTTNSNVDADEEEIFYLHTTASDVWAFAMTILQVSGVYTCTSSFPGTNTR